MLWSYPFLGEGRGGGESFEYVGGSTQIQAKARYVAAREVLVAARVCLFYRQDPEKLSRTSRAILTISHASGAHTTFLNTQQCVCVHIGQFQCMLRDVVVCSRNFSLPEPLSLASRDHDLLMGDACKNRVILESSHQRKFRLWYHAVRIDCYSCLFCSSLHFLAFNPAKFSGSHLWC